MQRCFGLTNIEFRNQFTMSAIQFGERLSKFMIPIETEEADGSMNHCSDKSQLMTMLEKEVDQS